MPRPSLRPAHFPSVLVDFQDRSFRLTEERWRHILDHPEHDDDAFERVQETVRDPDRVVQSRTDSSVELFYRWYEHTLVGAKYHCVVLKTHVEDPFVLTAYFTDTIKQGKELWNKPDDP